MHSDDWCADRSRALVEDAAAREREVDSSPSRWGPTNPRPFPMVLDRRGWASVRSQACAVGDIQVHDAA